MAKKLNIQPQTITLGTVSNLLNGAFASLSGPIGFTPEQPRIIVKRIVAVNPSTTEPVDFVLYKGTSGASENGTQVLIANVSAFSNVDIETDIVLDAGDFLTGTCGSQGSVIVNLSAEIEP